MTTPQQPSAGAVKLATVLNGSSHAHLGDAATIDRHVAPLVEALEQIQAQRHNRYESTVAIVVAKADAALKLWKEGTK